MVTPQSSGTGSRSGDDLPSFRAQIDLIQVAEMLTEVKRTGTGTGQILCPEHEDHRPSCTVYNDHYFCFTCKAHGDVFKLVMLLRDISFPEALDWVAEATGIARPTRSPEAEAAAATMRFFRKSFAEELDPTMELPYGLELEAARKLGLGKANQLAALVAEAPRPLFERDEIVNWNGAWTLELHGSGGPLGFGAFMEKLALLPPSSGSSSKPAAEALINTDPDQEAYELTEEDIPELAGSEDELAETETTMPPSDQDPALAAATTAPELSETELGPFVKSRALRYPAFGGLGAARETIARQHYILLTTDMSEMLELQAAGILGVIGVPGSVDEATAAVLAKLAPKLVLIITPERINTIDFLPSLRRLSTTGMHLELVPLLRMRQFAAGDLEGSIAERRVPVFSYLVEAALRAQSSETSGRALNDLAEWLAVLPSPSTRALYAAEAAKRGLPA